MSSMAQINDISFETYLTIHGCGSTWEAFLMFFPNLAFLLVTYQILVSALIIASQNVGHSNGERQQGSMKSRALSGQLESHIPSIHPSSTSCTVESGIPSTRALPQPIKLYHHSS